MHGPLQSLIRELGLTGRVRLSGFIADPFPVFRRAALAVSSSRYEGFGNAIVEAMATRPDRAALRSRAAMHTVTRAADALLGIINGLPGRAALPARLMEQTHR